MRWYSFFLFGCLQVNIYLILLYQAKVRARLSRPLQRGKGKNVVRGEFRSGHGPVRGMRSPWNRSLTHSIPVRGTRGIPPRMPPTIDRGFKRPASFRDRRPVMDIPPRARPMPPPPRPYERRPPGMRIQNFFIMLQLSYLVTVVPNVFTFTSCLISQE